MPAVLEFTFTDLFIIFCRTAGTILGAGASAFLSDWDKISTTVFLATSEIYFHQHS